MQGHIRKRSHTTKDGSQTTNWYVVIDLPRDADGKRRQKWHGGFRTRRAAEAARAKIVYEFNTGTYVEPSAVTLSEWVRGQWLPTIQSRVKPSTFDSYRRNLDLHVLPRLGSRQLRQLTRIDAQPALCRSAGRRASQEGGRLELRRPFGTSTRSCTRRWLMPSMRTSSGSTWPSEPSRPGREPRQPTRSTSGNRTN